MTSTEPMRTASGPRFTPAAPTDDLHAEVERIRNQPGLVEKARSTVRAAAPAARPLRHRIRLGWVKVRHNIGTLTGLSCFSAAAFQAGTIFGLVAVGASAIITEWVMR